VARPVFRNIQRTVLSRSVTSEVVVAYVRHCDCIFLKRMTKPTTTIGLECSSVRVLHSNVDVY
jgi:hypothetical protein